VFELSRVIKSFEERCRSILDTLSPHLHQHPFPALPTSRDSPKVSSMSSKGSRSGTSRHLFSLDLWTAYCTEAQLLQLTRSSMLPVTLGMIHHYVRMMSAALGMLTIAWYIYGSVGYVSHAGMGGK
jgi:hypothetical protein